MRLYRPAMAHPNRSSQALIARRLARERMATQAAEARKALETRQRAGQEALSDVLAADATLKALQEQFGEVEARRATAVTRLVEAIGRTEASQLLAVPERSLRRPASRRNGAEVQG